MVQRGLKCDMDKPAWGLSGTTDTYMVFAGGGRSHMQAGFEGVFLYGKRKAKAEKNKAEGELQVCQRACSSVTGQFVGLSGSASLFVLSLTPTGTGGKWAQLSSMRAMRARRAQGRAGR